MADQPPPHPPAGTDPGVAPPVWGTPPAGWGAPPPGRGSPPPGWGGQPPGWGGQPPAWGGPQPGWNPGPLPSQVGSGRFRSMSVGEWLDATFSLYRRNFVLIASISAVVQIPYALLTLLVYEVTGLGAFVRSPFGNVNTQTLTQAQATALLNSLVGVLAVSLGLLVITAIVVLPLGEAATTRAVSDRYLDRPTTLRAAYGAAWHRLGSLITMSLILLGAYLCCVLAVVLVAVLFAAVGAGAVGGAIVLLAVLAFIPIAILVLVRTCVAAPAIVLEKVSGWNGLQRSWNLIRGRFWPTFGRILLLGLISGIISGVLSAIFELPGSAFDPGNAFIYNQLASGLAAVFIGPITYIGVTLLYYDVRIRKEGFDIEMLASSL
ncbi:MAG: glycerophosphoryl diester phosphodiesterase membrane domain-containing protein [Candidatus Dormiibacterota bacterium]